VRAARRPPREVIELISFDAAFMARIREQPSFRVLLAQIELEDLDRRLESSVSGGSPPVSDRDAKSMSERREVFEVLARGEPLGADGVTDVLDRAMDESGALDPPLVLVAGDLRFAFDEIESLKAAVAAVRPLLPAADKKLKDAADAGKELLESPWLTSARRQAEQAALRIRRAFMETRRELLPDHLDELIERAVLEGRHYQRRTVFGQVWLRASLHAGGSPQDALLVYLPESLAKELPMFPEMKARVLAEVRAKQDKFEAHAVALRAVAMAVAVARAG
jgi:hypothetical protein